MLSGPTSDLLLSITMLCIFALAGGSFWLFRTDRDRNRAALMLIAALVLLGNVLIWTWPAS